MVDGGNVFDDGYIDRLASRFDDNAFQSAFNEAALPLADELVELKLGAMLAYEEWVAEVDLDAMPGHEDQRAGRVFDRWLAYVVATKGRRVELRDVLLMSVAALWARRPTELRHALRLSELSVILSHPTIHGVDWPRQVQETVSRALVLSARQAGRADLVAAKAQVDELRNLQRTFDGVWLDKAERPQQSALTLLALYHCAQAAIVLANYVLEGVHVGERGRTVNVGTELKTLLRKSQEYAALSSDPELMTWTKSVALIAEKLRTDSIWANGFNISQKIDALIRSISRRDGAILSVLPSQQEALERNLLDAQREAVVLQMPTSSGKTLMAELAILQTLSSYSGARAVYVTPTRALATQVRRTLGADFADLDIDVMATGSAFEEDPFELALLNAAAGVVVSTPEKLDLLLRAHAEWFGDVRLVVVDEAHLLNDGERGARLELLLANIRREHPHVRLLLLTPFVQNAGEVAGWLSGDRGRDVDVKWRPARLIVGLAKLTGRGRKRNIEIEWKEPHRSSSISDTSIHLKDGERDALRGSPSARTRTIVLGRRLRTLGPVLAMFPSSRIEAERAASQMASEKERVDLAKAPAELRVALAMAGSEYGSGSSLAECLTKGVAFHHSALSGELRYLIERLAAMGTLDFVAATTTLAQGMNFPVSSVVIHSISKPRAGPLSSAEFWNIAGRAGRVGLSEKGVVVFANSGHREHWERYTRYLSDSVESSLGQAIRNINESDSVKWTYRTNESLRPFIQYLGHSVARSGAAATSSDLERLVTASFAGRSAEVRSALTKLAKRYLQEVSGKRQNYMRIADRTGLASYSFDELYANIAVDPVLAAGSATALKQPEGLKHLVDALARLPELSLGFEGGYGAVNTMAIAKVVHGWMSGATVRELSDLFPGDGEADRIREAGRYVFGRVSQTVSWGAHAYLRGREMMGGGDGGLSNEHKMLPAYIQYGVNTPASVLASILGVPRQLASRMADLYVERHGTLRETDGGRFRAFLEDGPLELWRDAVTGSRLAGTVSASDIRAVWRDAQGLDRRTVAVAPDR